MSVSIELLDEYHKENSFTLIAGEGILLKFVPNIQPRAKITDVIAIADLPSSAELLVIKDIIQATRDLKNSLGNYVKQWSKDAANTAELLKHRLAIETASDNIKSSERTLGFTVCDRHYMSFCTSCQAYVGEIDNLTTKCSKCYQQLKDEGKIVVSYLDGLSNQYLDGGFWFEDYIARLLELQGWKVWTHGSVMGTSGMMHPVDILAIKDGKVLVAECKTGYVNTRDISHFMVQKLDIPSHIGLFFSLQGCSEKQTVSLFKFSTSNLIDNIGDLTDAEVIAKISVHMAKF